VSSLYVRNLPASATKEMLMLRFREFGTVLSVKLKRDVPVGAITRDGFVEMKTIDEAHKAVDALNGSRFEGRLISVNRASRA
jgi:RNA recognition motif-containing protein